MQRVYVDTCILLLACEAKEDDISQKAIEELDREVIYLYSSIVELEALPRPTVNKREEEVAFYNEFFSNAEKISCTPEVQNDALVQACLGNGLDAADALHVACARAGAASELITCEGPNKNLPKATGINVRSIRT